MRIPTIDNPSQFVAFMKKVWSDPHGPHSEWQDARKVARALGLFRSSNASNGWVTYRWPNSIGGVTITTKGDDIRVANDRRTRV